MLYILKDNFYLSAIRTISYKDFFFIKKYIGKSYSIFHLSPGFVGN